ncbi:protein ARV 2-like [Carex rostrata]
MLAFKIPMEGQNDASSAPRCIGCGSLVRMLYVQYSPGNIRLMKCEKCKAVADPYIECEFMIILIDLILHKVEAYRHLLFNMLYLDSDVYKGILQSSVLAYIFLDAYKISFLNGGALDSSDSLLSAIWCCAKILTGALVEDIIFMLFILMGSKFVLNFSYNIERYREVILAIIISSYLKLFLLSTMVWESPLSVIHIVNIFVLSSNIVALRVVTRSQIGWCVGICCLAHVTKILINHWLLQLL